MKSNRRDFLKTSAVLSFGLGCINARVFSEETPYVGFQNRIGICTGIENSHILINAGYSYLEESVKNFLIPSEPLTSFDNNLERLKNSGISIDACNSFLPGELKCVGPVIHHEEIIKYAETAFQRAENSGIRVIVFGSSGSRNIPDGFSREEGRRQFISLCSKMAPLAEKYGVVVCIEPLNSKECNFINSVSEGGEIVSEINHLNIRLLADIYHMKMENEGPESIIKYGKLLKHVHIAEREGRTAPGFHGEDFIPFFSALKQTGYDGRISIECRWDNLEVQAGRALQTLKSQISLS